MRTMSKIEMGENELRYGKIVKKHDISGKQ